MATDYDAPRKSEEELSEDSLQELQARRSAKSSGVVDEVETEAAAGGGPHAAGSRSDGAGSSAASPS